MKLKAYTDVTVFDELKDEWNDLVFRSTANRIFSTWEWHSTWWEAYHPGQLWVVTCRDDQDQLIGLAPWFVSGSDNAVSIIGCKEVTDYLDLIADKDHVQTVLHSLASYLAENHATSKRIEFCNLSEDSISYQDFPDFLKQQGFIVTEEPEDVCPIVSLPDTWTDYLNLLDKKHRHELRRKLRRAHGQNNIAWYSVSQEHDLKEEMRHFMELMAASDPQKAQFLQDEQNRDFFNKIVIVLMKSGWLQLNFLTINGERAAAYLNFDYNDEILVYNSGLRHDEYSHLSLGIVLLAFIIQHAIETGHTLFDFLQGNESYKYHMGGQDRKVFNLIAEYQAS